MVASDGRRERAQQALLSRLKRAGAWSDQAAHEIEVDGRLQASVLESLVRREIVRKGSRGGWWIDAEAYAEMRRRQLIFAIGAILVVAGAMACAMLYGH